MDHPHRDLGGKIAGLHALLVEHGEAVEADLQRYHTTRLSDLATGELSWRRLGVLVAALPRDSQTSRALYGEAVAWGVTEHLLATVVDLLQGANWQRSGSKSNRPKPIPRPGQENTDGTRIGTPIPLDEMKRLAAQWMGGSVSGVTREKVEVR